MKHLGYVTLGFASMLAACTEPIPVTVTELGTNLPPLASGFVAVDVSDTGHIVGNYGQLQNGGQAAVFLDTGEAVLLPNPAGYSSCQAVAVANDGRIAGYCNAGPFGYRPQAFFAASARDAFQFIPLGEGNHRPWDMNDNGVILGSSNTTSGTSHWTYDTFSGERAVLPELPNIHTFAVAINDAGDVAGITMETPADAPLLLDRAVKWSKGALAPAILPSPPGNVSSVDGINERGHIVGFGPGPLLGGTAFFWSSATALPEILPTPPAPAGTVALRTRALAVNDDGFIAGLANFQPISTGQGKTLGIVWTPDRRIIELGEDVYPEAINASEVIVGRQGTRPVRIELELTAP